MTDRERYKHLREYYTAGSLNGSFSLSPPNYHFLLKAYEENESLKDKVSFLKKQLKQLNGASV